MARIPWIIAGLLVALPVIAADEPIDDADITMRVLDEGETPDRLLVPIELPEVADDEASFRSESGRSESEHSERGQDTANQAREGGREFGESIADQARQRGEEARDAAHENAENIRESIRDRIGDRELDQLPVDIRDNIPDDIGPPEDAGPPDDIGPPEDAGPPDDIGPPDDMGPPDDNLPDPPPGGG